MKKIKLLFMSLGVILITLTNIKQEMRISKSLFINLLMMESMKGYLGCFKACMLKDKL